MERLNSAKYEEIAGSDVAKSVSVTPFSIYYGDGTNVFRRVLLLG